MTKGTEYRLLKNNGSWGILVLTNDNLLVQVLVPCISVKYDTVLDFSYEKTIFKKKIDGQDEIIDFLSKSFKGYSKAMWTNTEFDLKGEKKDSFIIKSMLHL